MNRYEEFSCRNSGKTEQKVVQVGENRLMGKQVFNYFQFFCMENTLYNNAIKKKKGMPKIWLEAFRQQGFCVPR